MTTENTQFPSLLTQAHNLMKQVVDSGTDVLKGKPLMASIEKAKARMDICNTCEFFKQTRCLKCGCFMEKKVQLESANCPINKWGDLQSKFTPASNIVPITSFPEEERERILDNAKNAAENKRAFYIGSKKYTSSISESGEIKIYSQEAPFGSPQRSIISGLTPEELVQFNALVQQAKDQENKKFTFKGDNFVVSVNNGRVNVSLDKI